MKINHYPKLVTEFIDRKVFEKYVKRFLSDVKQKMKLDAKITIDKFGIGSGPIYQMKGKTFNLRVYSSSFGSSDKMGSCYIVMQPICPSMPKPYDLGCTIHRSLAYYVNNPKYLVQELQRIIHEDALWKKCKPYMIKEKYAKNAEKYYHKFEESVEFFDKTLKDITTISHSRLESYHNLIKTTYLTLKQKMLWAKELKIKDTATYENGSIIPFKTFEKLAEKKDAKIVGKDRKLFYDKKNKLLYSYMLTAVDFIKLSKNDWLYYKPLLKIDDQKAYFELFNGCKDTAFLLSSKIYVRHNK